MGYVPPFILNVAGCLYVALALMVSLPVSGWCTQSQPPSAASTTTEQKTITRIKMELEDTLAPFIRVTHLQVQPLSPEQVRVRIEGTVILPSADLPAVSERLITLHNTLFRMQYTLRTSRLTPQNNGYDVTLELEKDPHVLPKSFVLLLADETGKVGKVIATVEGKSRTLTQAGEGIGLDYGAQLTHEPFTLSDEAIQKRFQHLLTANPPTPVRFTLYFQSGTAELTPESANQRTAVLNILADRPAPIINIIGHSDSVGSSEFNQRLSLQRANHVRDWLVTQDSSADAWRERINIDSHGESNPLFPTPDGVPEPRNRRVDLEIL